MTESVLTPIEPVDPNMLTLFILPAKSWERRHPACSGRGALPNSRQAECLRSQADISQFGPHSTTLAGPRHTFRSIRD
jgi:hypothetical protein